MPTTQVAFQQWVGFAMAGGYGGMIFLLGFKLFLFGYLHFFFKILKNPIIFIIFSPKKSYLFGKKMWEIIK